MEITKVKSPSASLRTGNSSGSGSGKSEKISKVALQVIENQRQTIQADVASLKVRVTCLPHFVPEKQVEKLVRLHHKIENQLNSEENGIGRREAGIYRREADKALDLLADATLRKKKSVGEHLKEFFARVVSTLKKSKSTSQAKEDLLHLALSMQDKFDRKKKISSEELNVLVKKLTEFSEKNPSDLEMSKLLKLIRQQRVAQNLEVVEKRLDTLLERVSH